MRRDNVVSVRLTDAERAQLARLSSPTDVLRGWLRAATSPERQLPAGVSVGFTAPDTVWHDGTVGRTWPPVETRSY